MSYNEKWKPSTFNVLLQRGSQHLLFNSASANILELTEPQRALIESSFSQLEAHGRCTEEAVLPYLFRLGFVVPDGEDEVQREHSRFLHNKLTPKNFFLTIAPTMKCNLRCTYCFQQEIPRSAGMKPDIRDGLVEFVRNKAKDSSQMVVQWFGGEPLLAFSTILHLNDEFQRICAERGISYYSEMLTNGTLLTPRLIEAFPRLALKAIQIPLDGDPETYARRKQVTIKKAEQFYSALIQQVQTIVELTGSVTLRINVDRDNADAGKTVVRLLKEHGVVDPRIDFRLGFLNISRGTIDCIPHDCFTDPEFAGLEQEFRQFLADEGYTVFGMPEVLRYPCTAAVRNSYTVDPEGRIGKCVPAIGMEQSTFSRIYPGNIERTLAEVDSQEHPYAGFDPFESPICHDCRLLPICLGSCPKMHEPGRTVSCSVKELLAEKLEFYSGFHRARHRAARQAKASGLAAGRESALFPGDSDLLHDRRDVRPGVASRLDRLEP